MSKKISVSKKTSKPKSVEPKAPVKAPLKSMSQEAFEIALEKIERAKLVVRAFRFVFNVIREANHNYKKFNEAGLNEVFTTVNQMELEQWRDLFLLTGVVSLDPKSHEKLKRMALNRFFKKDMHIADLLSQDFGVPTPWLTEKEEKLREEFAQIAEEVGLDKEQFLK